MGFIELAAAGWLVGNYIYHRWFADKPEPPPPDKYVKIPQMEEGANVPLIYGRCRVRKPILAWNSTPLVTNSSPPYDYWMNMHYIVGIPFTPGNNRFWRLWVGDVNLNPNVPISTIGAIPGTDYIINSSSRADVEKALGYVGGLARFQDGSPTQSQDPQLFGDMVAAGIGAAAIPAYRYFMGAYLFASGNGWSIGQQANVPGYSFEVSSYPNDSDAFNVGDEANPAKVLYDILTGDVGKLKIPTSMVDLDSFSDAKQRLQEEGNGYSRAIEESQEASEIILEILQQIDAVLYEDPYDGKIHIKLVRDDYDIPELPTVFPDNCDELVNVANGGWENVVNKVRIIFTNRADDYKDGSAVAHNQAVAAGQDGQVREHVIRMRGVCTQELANEIASRELSARSRPIAKCRAIVDRTFYQTVPGDVVTVTWPDYAWSQRVFRVAAVSRGELANGKIALELIEDIFYSWRGVLVPGYPVGDTFPGGGVGGLGSILGDP
jgi:hypothetical protein